MISVERFKRMVSMIRQDRGFVFATEWGLNKIITFPYLFIPRMLDIHLFFDRLLDDQAGR